MRQVARPPIGVDALPRIAPVTVPLWEAVLVVVTAVMFGTNVTDIVLGSGLPHRLLFLLIYAVFGGLLVCSKDALQTLLVRAPVLLLVLAVPPVSILWSVNPGETLERSVAVLGTSMYGAYLGWRFTLGRIVFLLAIAASISVCLSLSVIVLAPSIGIQSSGQWAGAWVGIHLHKNGLGAAASLACVVIGYAITDSRDRWRLGFCVAFLVAVVVLLGSRSTSALLATVIIGALAFWARYLQRRPDEVPVLTLILVITVVVTGIELVGADLIEGTLAYFGKNATLSSRVPLWSLLWSYIEEHFWLGYGYEAFWRKGAPQLLEIEAVLYFTPFYSHNGLLETWLNGGLVLVSLVILLLVIVAVRAMVIYVRWRELAISSFPLFFWVFFLMVNFSESTVLARTNLVWAVLVAMAVFVAKWVRLRGP